MISDDGSLPLLFSFHAFSPDLTLSLSLSLSLVKPAGRFPISAAHGAVATRVSLSCPRMPSYLENNKPGLRG